MNRKEQLSYCKRCTHKKMDFEKGIICELTNDKATFTDSCPDFTVDQKIEEEISRKELTKEIEGKKPGIGTLIIGLLLLVRGGMRISQGNVIFGGIMVLVGISSIIYYLSQLND